MIGTDGNCKMDSVTPNKCAVRTCSDTETL